jgi:hypothetical protein
MIQGSDGYACKQRKSHFHDTPCTGISVACVRNRQYLRNLYTFVVVGRAHSGCRGIDLF